MADSEIPADLLAAQRRYDAARAAVAAASARPGVIGEWPAGQRAELERLRTEERQAAVDLYRARAGTEFEPWAGQERLRDAAAEQG